MNKHENDIYQQPERRIIFLMLPDVHLLDVAGPAQVFFAAAELGARYTQIFCASDPAVRSAQGLVFAQLGPLEPVQAGDLVLVPGADAEGKRFSEVAYPQEIRAWLRAAYSAGAHIASICTGAFVLGAAGLLDYKRCTTHWAAVPYLQRTYPRANVVDNALFVHDQGITTSAGIASGIDMALAFVEQHYGPLFASRVARHIVIYLRRNGAQTQSSIYLEYRTHLHPGVHQAQDYLIQHAAEHVSLQQLAAEAQISVRSLTRAFKEATGLTPMQYHQRLKLELAANLIHNSDLTLDAIAARCGFDDARHFRRLWARYFGAPPSATRGIQKRSHTAVASA
jgi:transcriptional regulator GlxA family with amidase domain